MQKSILFLLVIFVTMSFACDNESTQHGNTSDSITILKTGQTTSYDTEDDGDLEKGTVWPDPRFNDNGDSTVTDNYTGLMWQKTPDNTLQNWSAAIDAANSSTVSTYDDWRIPNVRELESLCNSAYGSQTGWLHGLVFSSVENGVYWTSTTSASDITMAWYTDFSNTRLNTVVKIGNCYTWFVRQSSQKIMRTGQSISYATGDDGDLEMGVAWSNNKFTDNGDGTLLDNFTGLIWKQSSTTIAVNWATALGDARGHSFADKDDWRMPNKRELLSLLDYSNSSFKDTLTDYGFTSVQSGMYWTSTIYAASTSKAFVVYSDAEMSLDSGCSVNNEQSGTAYTMFVRN